MFLKIKRNSQATVVCRDTKTRKIGLDIVRACAIGLVLASHFFKCVSFLGLYGVEMFFALSGFLIGGILYRRLVKCQRWSFDEVKLFWARRWWRTLPNYYLFFALWLLYAYALGGVPTLAGLVPFLIFSQDLFSVRPWFYGVSWSLCVEEWFYFLVPLCILFFTSLKCSKRTAFVSTTVLFLVFPAVVREFMFSTTDPAVVRMLTIPRLDAIFYGVAMSFVVARYDLSNMIRGALLVASLICFLSLVIVEQLCVRTGIFVPFYRSAFLLLPICFCLTLPFFSSINQLSACFTPLTQVITDISLWSYSAYLCHVPLLWFIYAAFGRARHYVAIDVLCKLLGLGACFGVSKFIYTHYELKFLSLRPDEG